MLEIRKFPGSGICIKSDGNIVQGNTIHNNGADGICVHDGSNNVIGDDISTLPQGTDAAGNGNVIYENQGAGISIRHELATKPYPSGNSMLGNSVYSNVALGIDLGVPGVTVNDIPASPQNVKLRPEVAPAVDYRQNFPLLTYASISLGVVLSVVEGSLTSWPNHDFLVQIFLNSTLDPSGYGQGEQLIGSQWVWKTESTSTLGIEVPSGGGIGTSRAMAKAYGVFATGGKELGLRKETLEQLMAPAVPPTHGFCDEVMKLKGMQMSLGFMKPSPENPFAHPSSFGMLGFGGCIGFADPHAKVGFAYIPNQTDTYLMDPRQNALRLAMYRSIGETIHSFQGRKGFARGNL